jgi:cytochrome c-type biogenesis protein CcmH/NrfF
VTGGRQRAVWRVPGIALATMLLTFGLAASGATAPTGAPSDTAMAFDVEEALTCQCGCGLTVHRCNHLNCPSAIPMKEEIAKRIAQGQTKEQILDYFRNTYGEKVLSAPTLSGFNLAAWIVPFVVLAIGAVAVTRVARRWARETPKPGAAPPPEPAPAADDPYRARLAREIEEFDR